MAWTLAGIVWSGPKAIAADHAGGHNDTILRIIGARAWASLPAAVQHRFERTSPAVYDGETDTHMSLLGRFFSLALLAFGAPVPVLTGKRKAKVYVGVRDGGMSWTRVYRGPAGLTFSVRSIKRLSEDGRLFECCAGGWAMLLDVFADQGSLVFRSRNFYWRHGPVSIELPVWMTPGTAEVRHTDLGGGHFRFTLAFDHPWFGRTLFQDGVFADPTE
jgi:hypothetical protein